MDNISITSAWSSTGLDSNGVMSGEDKCFKMSGTNREYILTVSHAIWFWDVFIDCVMPDDGTGLTF